MYQSYLTFRYFQKNQMTPYYQMFPKYRCFH
jgi:hypothetical protein